MKESKVIVVTPDELRKIVVDAIKEATQGLTPAKQKPRHNPTETPQEPQTNPIITPDIKLGVIKVADSIKGGLQCPFSIIQFANRVNAKNLCELLTYVETNQKGEPLFDFIKALRGIGEKKAHAVVAVISALKTARKMANDTETVESWANYLNIDKASAKLAVFNMWFYSDLNDPCHVLYKFIPDFD